MSYPGGPQTENRRSAPASAAKDTTNVRGGDGRGRAWEASGPGPGTGTGTVRGRGRGPGGERGAGGSSGAGDGARAWGAFSLQGASQDVPRVWVSDRQPLQGETVTVRVTAPSPRTPWGHLHNLLRCSFGGGLVHMRIEEAEEEGATGVFVGRRVKPIPVFRDRDGSEDGADRWCGYVPCTPLDNPGPRTLTVEVADGRHVPRTMELRIRHRHFVQQSIWLDEDKAELLQGCRSEETARVQESLAGPST